MNKPLVLVSSIVAVCTVLGGVAGYMMDNPNVIARQSMTPPASSPTARMTGSQPTGSPITITKPIKTIHETFPTGKNWNGLEEVNPAWVKQVFNGAVVNASGTRQSLQGKQAILFAAPWCKYCHATLQLLQKEKLLNKVNIVNVALNRTETGGPPPTINNVQDAVGVVQQAMNKIGVDIHAKSTLFAMPTSDVNQSITEYPTLLVQHGGKWYIERGYVANGQFWTNIFGEAGGRQ